MTIIWTGDLDDECTALWCDLLLRAEWMDGANWWWAVSEIETGKEPDSSNNDGYLGMIFTDGASARSAAERSAREWRAHRTA